jgi:hypothetical protein
MSNVHYRTNEQRTALINQFRIFLKKHKTSTFPSFTLHYLTLLTSGRLSGKLEIAVINPLSIVGREFGKWEVNSLTSDAHNQLDHIISMQLRDAKISQGFFYNAISVL